jgi:hypothetical protein
VHLAGPFRSSFFDWKRLKREQEMKWTTPLHYFTIKRWLQNKICLLFNYSIYQLWSYISMILQLLEIYIYCQPVDIVPIYCNIVTYWHLNKQIFAFSSVWISYFCCWYHYVQILLESWIYLKTVGISLLDYGLALGLQTDSKIFNFIRDLNRKITKIIQSISISVSKFF